MAKKDIFRLLNEKKQPSTELMDIVHDKSINNRFDTLAQYFENEKITYNKEELKNLIQSLDKSIFRQVSEMAHLMYQRMKLLNKWSGFR